jgi:hypothetical protein
VPRPGGRDPATHAGRLTAAQGESVGDQPLVPDSSRSDARIGLVIGAHQSSGHKLGEERIDVSAYLLGRKPVRFGQRSDQLTDIDRSVDSPPDLRCRAGGFVHLTVECGEHEIPGRNSPQHICLSGNRHAIAQHHDSIVTHMQPLMALPAHIKRVPAVGGCDELPVGNAMKA